MREFVSRVVCENCKFYVPTGGDPAAVNGCCHRYPPTEPAKLANRFPVVGCVDWCGEFKAKGAS